MNCYLHSETPATAYCRSCGRPLCAVCQRTVDGVIYCQDHVPVPVYAAQPGTGTAGPANPYAQPAAPPAVGMGASPALAFGLGWIPGVGAIANAQYLKGLVHAIIFGLIISLMNAAEGSASQPFLGMMLMAFEFYMPFEAYHTAKKRRQGLAVDEWSSLIGDGRYSSRAPIGPIVLIAIGILFLLDTLNLIRFRDIGRFWPVLLIVAGAYMLYGRVTGLRSHVREQGYSSAAPATSANDPAIGVSREQ